ncbi:MAG: magnesium-translocating P-type ATPase [Candidatus Thorarchaeota archaeon]
MRRNTTSGRERKIPRELLGFTPEQVLERLGSSDHGLTSEEAMKRLEEHGPNEIVTSKRRNVLLRYLSHFKNPLIMLLLAAGTISLALGETQGVLMIYVIIVLSTLLTFYQESKAENAARLLRERVSATATVIRDGSKRELRFSELVPGDIISLSAGDMIPADARVIAAKDFFVNESALTGESYPVEKTSLAIERPGESITGRRNYLFMGTSVVSGTAMAVVTSTGMNTEYGGIAKMLTESRPPTEFEQGLHRFGLLIMQAALLLVIVVFALNAFKRADILEALLFCIALAVGLTPELLPMVTVLNLTKGAMALSRQGAIVKRLASIQNFGSISILCTDKTGTLTQNIIRLIRHTDIEGKNSDGVLLFSYVNSFYQTGLRSPLDEAILEFKQVDASAYVKVDEIPFDFVRRRVSVIVQRDNSRILIVKGAPEEILKVSVSCEHDGRVVELTESYRATIERTFNELSAEGLRVLGVAYREVDTNRQVYGINDESDLVFMGFVAFLDPPKESAGESIRLLNEAGVELKILTGDNEVVTQKVCEAVGMKVTGVLLGSEIANMTDEALTVAARATNVFARVSPAQKERIISVLRRDGYVVGYLGDGINDAPSLRAADVGISVDNAVDVAKESADIILLESDLTILQKGVIEGRKVFGNTMKYVMMGTSSNFGNMFSVAGASLFLPFLPMTATQILLNNLLYDVSQGTISTDDVDKEYVMRPKKWDIVFVRNFMVSLGPVSSLFDFLTFFIMIMLFQASASFFQTAWFLESLSTQTLVIFSIRTRAAPFWKNRPSRGLLIGCISVVTLGWLLPLTPAGELFGFTPPPLVLYLILAGILVVYIALVELVKVVFYRYNSSRIEEPARPRPKPYLGNNQRLLYDVAAAILMHPDESVQVDELLEILRQGVDFSYHESQVGHHMIHLQRGKFVRFDHARMTVTGESRLEDLIRSTQDAPYAEIVSRDIMRIRETILTKYGRIRREPLRAAA